MTTRKPVSRRRRGPVRRARRWLRQRRRAVYRRARRWVRKRVHRTRAAIRRRRMHRAARRIEQRRTLAASPTMARSITGKPRPARTATPSVPTAAAPMAQRVKRDKGGRFNGSTGAGKSAKKTAAKKATPMTATEREAARTARTLAAGNRRVARIDKRTR